MPRSRSYHLDLPFQYIHFGKNATVLNVIRIIVDILNKLSLFFLPIFLYELGKNSGILMHLNRSEFQRGMIFLGVFFLLLKAVSCVLSLPVGAWLKKNNTQKALVYAFICRICSFSMFYFFQDHLIALSAAVLFEAVYGILFWNSYNLIVGQSSAQISQGKNINLGQFSVQMILAMSPVVGALTATLFGLNSVFLVGIIVCLIGFIAALYIESTIKKNKNVTIKKWVSEHVNSRYSLKQIAVYARDSIQYVWPLYLFILFGTVARVGYIYALSLFVVITVSMFISNTDIKRSNHIVYGLTILSSCIWIIRIKLTSVLGIILVDASEILLYDSGILPTKINTKKDSNLLTHSVYSYTFTSMIGVLFWSLFCLLFYISNDWILLFITAAVSTILVTLFKDDHTNTIAAK